MVLVETTVRSPFSRAQTRAGTRYAKDFPTPVPASSNPTPPSLKRSATYAAMSRWLGRSSKLPSARATGPLGASRAATSMGSIRAVARGRGPLRSRRAPARGRRAPTARRSRLELALLRGRKQHVVEDQAVARRMRVERQVGRRVPDLVLLIFRIVPAEERPRPLAVVAMDVLDPGRPFLVSQHQVARLQPIAHERR